MVETKKQLKLNESKSKIMEIGKTCTLVKVNIIIILTVSVCKLSKN